MRNLKETVKLNQKTEAPRRDPESAGSLYSPSRNFCDLSLWKTKRKRIPERLGIVAHAFNSDT